MTKNFMSNNRLSGDGLPDLLLPNPLDFKDAQLTKLVEKPTSDCALNDVIVTPDKLAEEQSNAELASLDVIDHVDTLVNHDVQTDATVNRNIQIEVEVKQETNKSGDYLSVDNINKVCRTCLKEKDGKDLFNDGLDDVIFANILEMCTTLKIEVQDGLSTNICEDCVAQLSQWSLFQQKCKESQETLRDFKAELEKIFRKRDTTPLKAPLVDHDYEQTNTEFVVREVFANDGNMEFDGIFVKKPKYIKRFYVLKGTLNDKALTDFDDNLVEINERKAKDLIKKSAQPPQKIFIGENNGLQDEITAQPEPELISVSVKTKPVIRSRRFVNQTYSDAIKRAIKLVLAGRLTEANKLARAPVRRKRERRVKEAKERCVREPKQIFPGTCNICDMPYLDRAEYRAHARLTKHYFTRNVCHVCGKIFSVKALLETHMRIHTNEKPFMCEKCGACFRIANLLSTHMKVHSEKVDQPWSCKTCGHVFVQRGDLLRHRRMAHIERKVCCEICGAFIINRACLQQHIKRVHVKSKNTEQCVICGKEFVKRCFLQRHMRTHNEQFKCKLCNSYFKIPSKYMSHLKNNHPGADESSNVEEELVSIGCVYCEETCTNKQSVSIHLNEVHGQLVCKCCDKICETIEEMIQHESSHSGRDVCRCRYCGASYDLWSDLYVHLSKHSFSRHVCHICDRRYNQRSKLLRHLLMHTKEKMYPCQFCSKSFLYKASQQIHERIHTGERPYICDICGKGNICLSSFKRHRMTHIPPRQEV